MFYFVWALATFVIGLLSYNFGERYGRKVLANIVNLSLEETVASGSTGLMYQRLRVAVSEYL